MHDHIGRDTRRCDQTRVRLVAALHPHTGVSGRLAELLVPTDQAFAAYVVVDRHEPHLGQQGAYTLPAAVGQQEVIALGDDETSRRRDRERGGNGLLERSLETGYEESPIGTLMQSLQRRDVAVDVEGVGRSLAVASPESVELDVGEVEAIHRQVPDRVGSEVGAQPGQQQLGQGRFAGAWRASDPEHHALRPLEERRQTPHKLGQRVDLGRCRHSARLVAGATGRPRRTTPMGLASTAALASVDRMTDEVQHAATEAAQRVVEDVSSWQYSAEDRVIADELDRGLREAGVRLDDDERTRILEAIDGMKDEKSSAPQVRSATPVE